MSLTDSCARDNFDRISSQQELNRFAVLHCDSKFDYINMIDLFYNGMNQSGLAMTLFILLLYPIFFVGLATIADRYLSLDMKDLARRLNLSPTLAAVTLIAFANGAPDVLSSVQASSLESGNLISLGALYGAFIFSSTLVVSYVIINADNDIALPKLAITKELSFYFMSIVVVCVFGYIGKTGYAFVGVYWLMYAFYCWATYYVETRDRQLLELRRELEDGEVKNSISEQVNEDQNFELHNAAEKEYRSDMRSDADTAKEKLPIVPRIANKLFNPEYSMFENIVSLPLNLAAFVTISDLDNPLMSTKAEPGVCAGSLFFSIQVVGVVPLSVVGVLIVSIVVSALICLAHSSSRYKKTSRLAYQLIGVMASIAWIKIFSGLIIDFISFIAFYFVINQVVIAAILLSAGNTIGDFFGNAALAKAGEEVMGAMASYSSQIFNNFIGFSFNVLSTMKTTTDFDLFNRFGKSELTTVGTGIPLQNLFVIAMMLVTAFIILLSMLYYVATGFILKKWFSFVLFSIYFVFFVGSLGLGLMTEGN